MGAERDRVSGLGRLENGLRRPVTGTTGGRTSASVNGAPCARTTARTGTPGPPSRTTTRGRAPTGGARMGSPGSATSSSGCAWGWRSGTGATRSSRNARSG